MKFLIMKSSTSFFIVLFITASAFCQSPAQMEEQKIMDLVTNSFQEILSENKKEELQQYYSEDFLLLEDGEVWDLDKIREMMDMAAEMEKLPERINSFNFIELKIAGRMAWVAYHNKAVFKVDGNIVGEMNWMESAVAIETEEGWKLQMLHSTVIDNEQE